MVDFADAKSGAPCWLLCWPCAGKRCMALAFSHCTYVCRDKRSLSQDLQKSIGV